MRAVVLTTGQPNQMALCHELGVVCQLVHVVVAQNRPGTRLSLAHRLTLWRNRLDGRLAGQPCREAWQALQARYRARYSQFPEVPCTSVRNINEPQTLRVLQREDPDLVIVSGTTLVETPLIAWAAQKQGIVNLHTGLSPYVRGGPNCTNWCLAQRTFHLIGNTVLWLDAGIDAGPIITSEQTPLTGTEDLVGLHWKVTEHAHALLVRAIARLAAGLSVPRVPQHTIARGRLFTARQWNALAMRAAWRNFRHQYTPAYFASEEYRSQSARLMVVPLTECSSTPQELMARCAP